MRKIRYKGGNFDYCNTIGLDVSKIRSRKKTIFPPVDVAPTAPPTPIPAVFDQVTIEKLKNVHGSIMILQGKRERAEQFMNENEKYGMDMYLKHVNEAALEFLSIVKRADRVLTYFMKSQEE